MRPAGWALATACTVAMAVGGEQFVIGSDGDGEGHGRRCSEATIRGNYGIQMQGTRPAPGGQIEAVIGVVLRTYDGVGNVEQVDNVKGSITGIIPDRPGFGTYEVSPDCSGVVRFEPGPGVLIEERFVIVDHGNEIRSITSAPAGIMVTSVQRRIKSAD